MHQSTERSAGWQCNSNRVVCNLQQSKPSSWQLSKAPALEHDLSRQQPQANCHQKA